MEMLNNDDKIIVYMIDEKHDGCERSKQLSYRRKEIIQKQVLETTMTMSGIC